MSTLRSRNSQFQTDNDFELKGRPSSSTSPPPPPQSSTTSSKKERRRDEGGGNSNTQHNNNNFATESHFNAFNLPNTMLNEPCGGAGSRCSGDDLHDNDDARYTTGATTKVTTEPKDMQSKLVRRLRGLWKTRLTEDTDDDRELYVKTTVRELVIYIGFITILCILTFGMTSSTMFYFTKVMRGLFVDEPQYEALTTMKGFWDYAEKHLLDGLYWEKYYNDDVIPPEKRGYIYFENKLLGLPRLRQVRVRNNSCQVHKDFSQNIKECYAPYSASLEDTSHFRDVNESAYRYQTSDELRGNTFYGKMATYEGGGYTLLLDKDKATSKKKLASLKENLWLDRGTRAVFIDFTVYNANINLFCIITLVLEYPPTGGCVPYSKFRTLKLLRYVTSLDYFVMACELIFVIYLIYYSVEEIIEIRKHRLAYFTDFWNIFDIVVIVMGIMVVIFNLYRVVEVDRLLKDLLQEDNQYANFETLGHWQELFNDFIAVAVFFAWIKVFKYISFNKTMTQLQSTLARCAKDIAGFAVMFFIIFLAYAQWGYLIFGTQVEGFSTYMASIFTLFRIILGDFNFREIEEANRYLGPVFFITYVFFVFFVLINMFLAIINDTYAEVKDELSQQESEFQIADYFKKGYEKMMTKLSFKREKIVDIQKALQTADTNQDNKLDFEEWRQELKIRGHADAEIEAVFAKYDIDGDRVLSEGERRKMQEDLEGQKAELSDEIEEVERAQNDTNRLRSRLSLQDGGEGNEVDVNSSEDDDDDEGSEFNGKKRGSPLDILTVRVDRVERCIGSIVSKIDAVLLKLETMDKAKVKRRETMTRLLDSITEQGSTGGGGGGSGSGGGGEDYAPSQIGVLVRNEMNRWEELDVLRPQTRSQTTKSNSPSMKGGGGDS